MPGSMVFGVACRLADRWRPGRDRLGIGRLVAPGARRIDRAKQHLQQMDRAAGLEAVGVGGNAAHRVHRDRPADHRLVPPARRIGPRLIAARSPGRRRRRQFGGDAADRRGRDAAAFGDRIGRVVAVEIALGEQLEHRHARRPSGSVTSPSGRAHAGVPHRIGALAVARSQASGLPSASRANSPSSAPPGRVRSPARWRWCSAPGNPDRRGRRAAARAPAPARTARRCRAGSPTHSSAIAE